MKLKGDWSSLTSYSVGDVVKYSNGNVYILSRPCKAGVPPTDTNWWTKTTQEIADMVTLILDGMAILETKIEAEIPKNIDEDSIVLTSGDNEYLISVDATGETPEVIAELIVPDDAEGADT